jgi:choline dehydrogenase-like flavoprotein
VDPDFAVRGAPGVYACDASVFPAAITVNPQMTVMALAEYAAERIE